MLDIEFIRTHAADVKEAVRKKRFDVDIDRLLAVDAVRRAAIQESEVARARRNELSSLIPKLPAAEKAAAVAEAKGLRETIASLEEKLSSSQSEFDRLMLLVPNVPLPEVPDGATDEDNVEVRRFGEPRAFDFTPKDHVELATSLGLVDFEGPRKYAGSRAYALTGDGVLLEQAVLNFTLQHVVGKGFKAVSPPVMVRDVAMQGTGFFPLGREDTFAIEKDELFLVGTSEVGLVSLLRDTILDEKELPIRLVGISPCFRREAGAAGRDTRGLYRVYQFQKVEQVVFCANDAATSAREHELILGNAEEILRALGIPHRVALACSGEMGQGQVRKHEIESWMPSRGKYSETHSCSTMWEFQARRSMIRYRDADGKIRFVHTLNNTAIASPRILIPLLENFQQADGSVVVPPPLRPFMGGRERIVPGALVVNASIRVAFGVSLLVAGGAWAKETGHRVVVLGDSRTDGCVGAKNVADCRANDPGYDVKTLSRLLDHAADKHPDAVFFTGDLTLGYERESDEGMLEPSNSPAANGWARDYEYDTTTFARMLGDFAGTVGRSLKTIPFHPVVGNHDTVGPDALAIFRALFKLNPSPEGAAALVGGRTDIFVDPAHLAYVVAPDGSNAAFVVIATDYYVACKGGKATDGCNLQEHHVSAPQMEWLDHALEKQRGKTLFVLGHEPAFSALPALAPVGLDVDPPSRDAFWALLVKHRVTAYLCSHQHRYNISQHEGVWQIISGGGGAPLDRQKPSAPPPTVAPKIPLDLCTGGVAVDEANRATSFFNYALLTLPAAAGEPAVVEIRDCNDHVRAALPLTPGFAIPLKAVAKLPATTTIISVPATSPSPPAPASTETR